MALPKHLEPHVLDVDKARAISNKRWAATAQARAEKRIDELVRMAPPLSETARAKLRALLGEGR